jgi:hypothetical protein
MQLEPRPLTSRGKQLLRDPKLMAVIKVTQNIQRSASRQVVKKASKQGRFKAMKFL